MKKYNSILVTGGAGFIGSHLVEELLKNGFKVTVIDNLSNGKLQNLNHARKSPKFFFVKGDVLNDHDCIKVSKNIDIVFHLACLGVRHSIHSPIDNHKINAEGTIRVLEAARRNNVKKFFYISSSEIYGGVDTFPIKEAVIPKPFTVYGASKLAGEHYSYAYYKCYGLNTIILRIFNNYGPRAHFEGDAGELIPRTIVNAIFDKPPIIFGDGKATRDFFYVKDTAKALVSLINRLDLPGEIINIGTGVEMTVVDVVKTILKIMHKQKLRIKFLKSRPADVPRLWVNADKFYHLQKFQPSCSFEEGLKDTIEYYKKLSKRTNLLAQFSVKNWIK